MNDARLRKLVAMDTEPGEYVAAVGGQSLVVTDEVVADAARLTQLVDRSPVTVQRPTSSPVDDVLNELSQRHRTVVRAVLAFDVGCDLPKVPTASGKKNLNCIFISAYVM